MKNNYHTHTARCHHASGTDRQYVEEAIARGMKVLGFSDHSPYLFDGDYYSTFRMRPEETEEYVNSVLSLREEYKADIEILLGFETEYYPRYFERLLRFYENYPIDYLILGQHFIENEIDGVYSMTPNPDARKLRRYAEQVCEGLRTGCFTYLAHPDLFAYSGDPSVYREADEMICRTAKELQIPLEINLLGIRSHRSYPRRSFWTVAAEYGCKVVLGSDAHSPDMVSDPVSEAESQSWICQLGLHLIEEIPINRSHQEETTCRMKP